MQNCRHMTCDCSVIMSTNVDQMFLISGNTGSLSMFCRHQRPNFIMVLNVNTLVCLKMAEGPCDFIICSQRKPEQTSWQGDYFGIWTQLSNYYAMPLGLIYCTPHNARQITFWEKDSGRPVCLCVFQTETVCVCVCVCLASVYPWKITYMRLLAGMIVSMLREISI